MTPRPTADDFWCSVFPEQAPVVWRRGGDDNPLVELARGGRKRLVDELRRRSGARTAHVAALAASGGGKMGFGDAGWQDWATRTTTLAGFLDDLRRQLERPNGDALYMQSAPVRRAFPELEELMSMWIVDEARMMTPKTDLWIGSGGHRVAIHQDASHSVMCMVAGRKELFLFPPDQQANLYMAPRRDLGGEPWRGRPDPRAPDVVAFPRFERAMARAHHVVLEAGDLLFLPARWWHAVDSFDFNVMFNVRWFDVSAGQAVGFHGSFAHAVLAARDAREAREASATLRDELRDVSGRAGAGLDADNRAALLETARRSLGDGTTTRDGAAAHVALVTADLPPHHRDALLGAIDTFGFCTSGDPFPGIAWERQGILGNPLSERARHQLARTAQRALHG